MHGRPKSWSKSVAGVGKTLPGRRLKDTANVDTNAIGLSRLRYGLCSGFKVATLCQIIFPRPSLRSGLVGPKQLTVMGLSANLQCPYK